MKSGTTKHHHGRASFFRDSVELQTHQGGETARDRLKMEVEVDVKRRMERTKNALCPTDSGEQRRQIKLLGRLHLGHTPVANQRQIKGHDPLILVGSSDDKLCTPCFRSNGSGPGIHAVRCQQFVLPASSKLTGCRQRRGQILQIFPERACHYPGSNSSIAAKGRTLFTR